MEWPFRRFLKAFDAYQRRRIVDEWANRKALHLAALHANSNWDEEKNDRPAALKEIEHAYDATMAMIWNGPDSEQNEAEETSWNSDFMNAGRRAMASITPPSLPGEAAIGALPHE